MLATALKGQPSRLLEDDVFEQFRKIAFEQAGLQIKSEKKYLVAARVAKRLRALGLADYRSYLDILKRDGGSREIINYIDAVSTNYTMFFREAEHFNFLQDRALEYVKEGRRRLRFWSAGCSTGQEPYSMAIALDKVLHDTGIDYKILASDISIAALQKAELGIYTAQEMERVPPGIVSSYFHRLPDASASRLYRVNDEIRSKIVFKRLNLNMGRLPISGPINIIFCRNVMIYFDKETRRQLLSRLQSLLDPSGHLIVGQAESIAGIANNLKKLDRLSIYSLKQPSR